MKRQKRKRKYRLVRRMNARVKGNATCFCGEPATVRIRFVLLDGGRGAARLCATCDDAIDTRSGEPAHQRWQYGMHDNNDFREFIECLRAVAATDALLEG